MVEAQRYIPIDLVETREGSISRIPEIVLEEEIQNFEHYTTHQLSVTNIEPTTISNIDAVEVASFTLTGADIVLDYPGSQSWSFGGKNIPLDSPDLIAPLGKSPIAPKDGVIRIAECVQVVVDGVPTLFGFKSVSNQGYLELRQTETGVSVSAKAMIEGIDIPSGETITTDPLLVISEGTAEEQYKLYIEILTGTKFKTDKKGKPYWCTWYESFERVTPETILNALPVLQKLAEINPAYKDLTILLDDGWQKKTGDWKENQKFKERMHEIVVAIKAVGFKPGIWIAPLVVNEQSDLFKEHPEWLVQDQTKGGPLFAKEAFGGKNYALDISHPDVQEWYRQTLNQIKEWGFEVIKFDFLFAGILPGKGYDSHLTSEARYKLFWEITFEVLGEDVECIACGAPWRPGVDKASIFRIATDTLTEWNDNKKNGDGSRSGYGPLFAAMLERIPWLSHEYIADLDALILRKHDTSLTPSERALVLHLFSLVANESSSIGIGDLPQRMEPEIFDTYLRLYPLANNYPISIGPYHNGLPTAIMSFVPPNAGNGFYMGIFNWKNTIQPVDVQIPYHEAGYFVTDAHDGTLLMTTQSPSINPYLDAHGSKLLLLTPIDTSKPQIISVASNMMGKSSIIKDTTWECGQYHISFSSPITPGTLMVALPTNARLMNPPENTLLQIEGGQLIATIPLDNHLGKNSLELSIFSQEDFTTAEYYY